jgi:hypothetical protein
MAATGLPVAMQQPAGLGTDWSQLDGQCLRRGEVYELLEVHGPAGHSFKGGAKVVFHQQQPFTGQLLGLQQRALPAGGAAGEAPGVGFLSAPQAR